jgi:hypothetical protein
MGVGQVCQIRAPPNGNLARLGLASAGQWAVAGRCRRQYAMTLARPLHSISG